VAEAGAVPLVEAAEAARLGLSHIADRALRIGGLPLEVVAALKVELAAGACSPAHLVGRMAANLRAGERAVGRIWCGHAGPHAPGSIVATAGVMRGHHQLCTAPGLVDTPVRHDVREPDLGSVVIGGCAEERVAELRI